MMDRLSTSQLLGILTRQVTQGQERLFSISSKLSTGKKFNNAYEDPVAASKAQVSQGDLIANRRRIENVGLARLELDSAEGALSSMQDMVFRLRELVVQSSSGQYGSADRELVAQEVRQIGESMISMANTKVAGKYIFSGLQSDIPTFNLASGDTFTNAVYKGGSSDVAEREYDDNQSSVNLNNLFTSNTSVASISGTRLNPTISANGTLLLTVNNGNGTQNDVSVSLTAGDDLSTVITKINTGFLIGGGLGQIATEAPSGHLNLNTNLIIGDLPGDDAFVQVKDGSDLSVLTDLGYKPGTYNGGAPGLLYMLNTFESALNTNNVTTLQSMVESVDYNLERVIEVRGEVGALTQKLERVEAYEVDLEAKLIADISSIEDIDVLSASQEYQNAQAALQAAVQTSSNFFQSAFRSLGAFL